MYSMFDLVWKQIYMDIVHVCNIALYSIRPTCRDYSSWQCVSLPLVHVTYIIILHLECKYYTGQCTMCKYGGKLSLIARQHKTIAINSFLAVYNA